MKSVILCGSISAAEDMIAVAEELQQRGFKVEFPYGVHQYITNGRTHLTPEERAVDKKQQDLISRYFKLINDYDIVLVVNVEKNGIKNYIGGNTFLEMGFGHVLGKALYTLNPLPEESTYLAELEAMSPISLDGDLDKLNTV